MRVHFQRLYRNPYLPAGIGVFDCIFQKVGKYFGSPLAVMKEDGVFLGFQLNLNLFLLGFCINGIKGVHEGVVDGERRDFKINRVLLQFCHFEQGF